MTLLKLFRKGPLEIGGRVGILPRAEQMAKIKKISGGQPSIGRNGQPI